MGASALLRVSGGVGGLMEGRRVALLVATDRYEDTGLSRLTAPGDDVRQLAAVLGDPRIAGFEVTSLHNEPHHIVGKAIGKFYRDRRHDDLTLLYFTGHGVKDEGWTSVPGDGRY